jgi:subtilase family serine protease
MIIGDIVKNQGTVGTGSTPFRVGFYLSKDKTITTSDTFLGSRSVSSLAAGASSQAATQVRIPADLTLGTYFIGAIADDTNVITETNELNNNLAGNSINITH